jgi:hypothetical protein
MPAIADRPRTRARRSPRNCGGPAGILTINVDGALIQFNEVYNVQPAPRYDNGCDCTFNNRTYNGPLYRNANQGAAAFSVTNGGNFGGVIANNLSLLVR